MKYRLLVITKWNDDRTPYFPPMPNNDEDIRNDYTGREIVPPDPNATVWEVFTPDPSLYTDDAELFILSIEKLPEPIEVTDEPQP